MKTLRRLTAFSFLVFALAILSACGGGTTGSGDLGVATKFSGRISDTNGQPLEGVDVTVEESGDSAKSDENGRYEIATETDGDNAKLLFSGTGFEDEVSVNGLPGKASTVNIDVAVDSTSNLVSVQSITITVDNGPETPTPAPGATRTPQAAPTPAPATAVIAGTVTFSDGVAAPRVSVSRAGYTSDITDRGGHFTLKSRADSTRIKLQVVYKHQRAVITLSGLPLDASYHAQIGIKLNHPSSGEVGTSSALSASVTGIHIRRD